MCGQTGDCVTTAGAPASGSGLCSALCECLHSRSAGPWGWGLHLSVKRRKKKKRPMVHCNFKCQIGAAALKVMPVNFKPDQFMQYSLVLKCNIAEMLEVSPNSSNLPLGLESPVYGNSEHQSQVNVSALSQTPFNDLSRVFIGTCQNSVNSLK